MKSDPSLRPSPSGRAASDRPPRDARTRRAGFRRFWQARLSPEGHLGLHLTVGAVLLVVASAVFGLIADDVVSGAPITLLDVQIAQWLHAHARATAGVTLFMLVVTHIHGVTGIAIMSVGIGLYLRRVGARYWLLSLTIAVAGGALINIAMKYAFQRARPSFDEPLLTLMTYSFPSGHTSGATVFYGVLACYLLSRTKAWGARLLIVLVAVFMVLLVGLSRMYLGVHYFTDVLAAIAESTAWLSLTVTAVSTLRRHRQYHQRRFPDRDPDPDPDA